LHELLTCDFNLNLGVDVDVVEQNNSIASSVRVQDAVLVHSLSHGMHQGSSERQRLTASFTLTEYALRSVTSISTSP
jgi:hypothetical protein